MSADGAPGDAPARAWPTAYPRIPAGPPAGARAPARDPRPHVAVVALVAALLGALLGAGIVVATLDRQGVLSPPATPVVAQAPPPTLRVRGAEDLGRVVAVAEAVRQAVVQVDIAGAGVQGVGNGSGVVYRSDGYVVTNNHVVAPAERVLVRFADGTQAEAEVVGTDRESDLAVLRVDRSDLQAITIGDPDELSVGELAIAVGSPFGLGGSVTSGIVSAVDRGPISVRAPDGGPVSLVDVVQTDAAINPGNSGGPLLNGDAELIGINSAILTNSTGAMAGNAGVGFAIPADLVVQVADELISSGEVRHAFLGVSGLPLSPELAAQTGAEAGAYVERVEPGTPAAAADIREGDVILAVDGQPIDSVAALQSAIREAEVGARVRVTYRRGGSETTVEVTLAERQQERTDP